VAIQEYWVLF